MLTERTILAEQLTRLLEEYYTRYYRDTLGLPDWRAKVAGRLREEDVEAARLGVVADIIGRPLTGLRVLNLGCGTGGFNAAAERAGAETWGIDANPQAIRICQLRRQLGAGGRYVVALAEELPFADDVFDLVYCLSTLEHVGQVDRAIRQMVRVTRPGGMVWLYAPNSWGMYENHYKLFWLPRLPRPLARLYLRALGRPTAFVETLNSLTPGRCARLLRDAGATVEPFELVKPAGTAAGLGRLVQLYYRVFSVNPAIQLLARKATGRKP